MPVHLLAGLDDVSIDDELRGLVASARFPAGLAEANLTRFDAATWSFEAFKFACEAMPFLVDGRVVICRGVIASLGARDARPTARAQGAPAAPPANAPSPRRVRKAVSTPAAKAPDEALAEFIPVVPATTLAIFVEVEAPKPASALGTAFDPRRVNVRPFPLPEGDAMVRWLRDRARRDAGGDPSSAGAMSVDAARLLAAHVGSDVRLAAAEVRKLVTHAGAGRPVEARDVELLTPMSASRAAAWELTQAMLDGNRERTGARMAQLLDGTGFRPEQVIASVRSAIAQHLSVHALGMDGVDDATIAREMRMQPFAVRMTRERAARLGDRALAYMHRQVLEADLSIKTGRVANARLAAELLVIELAARAVQAMQARAGRRT